MAGCTVKLLPYVFPCSLFKAITFHTKL